MKPAETRYSADAREARHRRRLFPSFLAALLGVPIAIIAAGSLVNELAPCHSFGDFILAVGAFAPTFIAIGGLVVFRERWRVAFFASLLTVWTALAVWGLVGFRYPRLVENDPFRDPVRVTLVDGSNLLLEDGRQLRLLHPPEEAELLKRLHASESLVQLSGSGPETFIWVKERSWLCGTPWAYLIRVPLIPDDVPMNHLAPLGLAVATREPP